MGALCSRGWVKTEMRPRGLRRLEMSRHTASGQGKRPSGTISPGSRIFGVQERGKEIGASWRKKSHPGKMSEKSQHKQSAIAIDADQEGKTWMELQLAVSGLEGRLSWAVW